MSLTQYLESQKDQDMIRLLNFTKTQKRRDRGFCVLEWMRWGVYILVVGVYIVLGKSGALNVEIDESEKQANV